MARVDIPVNAVNSFYEKSLAGTVASSTPVAGDATNDHEMVNNGTTILVVDETAGGTPTIILRTSAGVAVLTHQFAANGLAVFGPFPVRQWGSPIQIDTDAAGTHFRAVDLAGKRSRYALTS